MNRVISRRLEMFVRARDFSEAHPSDDPSYVLVLGRLKEGIDRMVELGGQQVGGFLSTHASSLRRSDIRRKLRDGLLRHLVTVAEDAASEKPELGAKFQLPKQNLSHVRFQNVARKMLEQGQAEQELLVKHGLSATLLGDLAAAVAEFDGSVAESNSGRQGHILASAELRTVSEEVLQVVEMMDGLNRYRFQKEPQLLVAWESARHVVSGPQAAVKEEAPVTPPVTTPVQAGEPVTPPVQAGEVKPAA
jgi:hypothetical protein